VEGRYGFGDTSGDTSGPPSGAGPGGGGPSTDTPDATLSNFGDTDAQLFMPGATRDAGIVVQAGTCRSSPARILPVCRTHSASV
jgi:hypothetical protein